MAAAEGWRRSLKGLREAAFRERFGTEEACRAALFEMRWREGLTCPACGHRGFCALKTRRLFQCNRCKKPVRLTAGTVFQDTKLPLTVRFTAIYHLTQSKGGISSIELGRRLGVTQATAWLLEHKLMRAMAEREAKKPKLKGRVEIDDAYLGGERSGGKRGRGAAGKTPRGAAGRAQAAGARGGRRPRRPSSPRPRPRPSASHAGSSSRWSKAFARRRSRSSPSVTSRLGATSSAMASPAGRRSRRPAAITSRWAPAPARQPTCGH